MDDRNSRPEVVQARATGRGMSMRHSNRLNADVIYVAIPVTQGRETDSTSGRGYDREARSGNSRRPWMR
jgi:hypothetical protein